MISKKSLWRVMATAIIPTVAFSACSDDENGSGEEFGDGSSKFVFATTVATSTESSSLLITGPSIDEGTLTVNSGLRNDGATQWVFYKNFLYALTYNQGNAGTTRSYILGNNGQMKARDSYVIMKNRFSSYGTYDNDIIAMSTGEGPANLKDANNYSPMTLLVTYIDVYTERARNNDTESGLYSMENFLGNGEYVTLAGAEQSGSKLFCGVVPMGLSQYGVADGDGKWIRKDEEKDLDFSDLVHKEAGGSGAGSYKAGELVGTQYPDECWVAIYDNDDFLNPKVIKTDKISAPCGRYRSQYYQTVWAADNGDVYVFSSSYSVTMTDERQKTGLKAGVCRIKSGTTEFDDYYCNIEELTPGGNRSFMRCWPAGGNSFLMVMYDRPLTESGAVANELAIFNADSKTLTYVTGLPEEISSVGKTVYTQNGCVYIPVNVENQYPAIYAINVATGQATKGVTIQANDINGFGYMTPSK